MQTNALPHLVQVDRSVEIPTPWGCKMRHMLAEWSIAVLEGGNVDGFIRRALVSWSLLMRLRAVRGGEALVTV